MRVILVFLLSALIPLANASLPLPQVVPDVGPGGGIVTSMRAQAELQNQYLQNQMLREQIVRMQQREQEAIARSSSNNYQLSLFNNEYGAQNHCPNDEIVWLNLPTGIWHYKGARWYGNTMHGSYVCKEEAQGAGYRASLNGS